MTKNELEPISPAAAKKMYLQARKQKHPRWIPLPAQTLHPGCNEVEEIGIRLHTEIRQGANYALKMDGHEETEPKKQQSSEILPEYLYPDATSGPDMSVIEFKNVRKEFRSVTAVDGLDLTVEQGEVFGYLGPNGAGKSTTIDLLLDFLRPTDGTVTVFGMDSHRNPVDIRQRTGILPEGFSPMKETTGREHIEFAISAQNADDDSTTILERVGLLEDADRNATDYSKGMLQRMALGMALVGNPDLLILDEPSGGLDPYGVRLMREIVTEERDRGAAVFFSSHLLEQVEAVADRVGILNQGQIVSVNTIDGLREEIGGTGELSVTLDCPAREVKPDVETLDATTVQECDANTITATCPADRKAAVIDAVRKGGAEIRDFETRKASLEDLFVARTEART